MKKLYEKNLLAFALILSGVYVVGMSALENLPNPVFAAVGAAGGSVLLLVWLKSHRLLTESAPNPLMKWSVKDICLEKTE